MGTLITLPSLSDAMTTFQNDLLYLFIGIGFAWAGGELFVRGLSGVGYLLRIPAAIVGVTLAAFATSAPEVSVGVKSAQEGLPQLSLGDVLGSNVANVALILGLALLLAPLRANRKEISRDFFSALLVPCLIGLLALDGELSRVDAGILLGTFLIWLSTVIISGLKNRSQAGPSDLSLLLIIGQCCLGLACLIGAGSFIVTGARGVALAFGLSEFVIGATIVAVSTSAPELATTLVARLRKEDDLGLGNILGSNIFNGLFIVGLVAWLSPFTVDFSSIQVALASGIVATLFCWPVRGQITRVQGVLLLLLYVAYVAYLLTGTPGAGHSG
jgi:cation:H+ antiporter